MKRYEKEGYLRRISLSEAKQRYGAGTISKFRWILKTKQDGSLKRRIVIDLRRIRKPLFPNGSLPRPNNMAKFQHKEASNLKAKYKRHGWDTEDWAKARVIIDLRFLSVRLREHPTSLFSLAMPSSVLCMTCTELLTNRQYAMAR